MEQKSLAIVYALVGVVSVIVVVGYYIFKKSRQSKLPIKTLKSVLKKSLDILDARRLAERALKVFVPDSNDSINYIENGTLSGDFSVLYLSGEMETLLGLKNEPVFRVKIHSTIEGDYFYYILKEKTGFLWAQPPNHFGNAYFRLSEASFPIVIENWKFDEDLDIIREKWGDFLKQTESVSLS